MTDIFPKIPRLPYDKYFMLHAALTATRSTCNRGPVQILDSSRCGVGAVIVKEHRIIASGYNGSPPGEPHCNEFRCSECKWVLKKDLSNSDEISQLALICPKCGEAVVGGHILIDNHCIRTLHAEENALLQCALDGVSPRKGTVYTTASPCWDCSKRLVRVGISRIVYAAEYDSRYRFNKESYELLIRNNIQVNHINAVNLFHGE